MNDAGAGMQTYIRTYTHTKVLLVLFLVLLVGLLAMYNVAAVCAGIRSTNEHVHQRWVYIASCILAPLAWLLLGFLYPMSQVLAGACALPCDVDACACTRPCLGHRPAPGTYT